jgi:hypothetical protein
MAFHESRNMQPAIKLHNCSCDWQSVLVFVDCPNVLQFRGVDKIAKNACYLRRVFPSVRLSASIHPVPTGRIFLKFNIEDFYYILYRKPNCS